MSTTIQIIAPLLIITYMAGSILMLETQFPVHLNLNMSASEESFCSGLFCNKHRFRNWMEQRGCSCYHMNQRIPSLVLNYTLSFVLNNIQIKIQNSSSTKFSKLYLTSNLPPSIRFRDLCMLEYYLTF